MSADHDDDGHAVSYEAVRRGTPVRSADGVEVGKVRRSLGHGRERIFDGIAFDPPGGQRFVDAPEVRRIAERAVTLTIDADEVQQLPRSSSDQGGDLARKRNRLPRWGRR